MQTAPGDFYTDCTTRVLYGLHHEILNGLHHEIFIRKIINLADDSGTHLLAKTEAEVAIC